MWSQNLVNEQAIARAGLQSQRKKKNNNSREWSQWPRRLKRRSAVACLLKLWVRIPLGAWMSVGCQCCVLSGRGLCDELITRPEKSSWLECVVVCDTETSRIRRPWPTGGCCAKKKKKSGNMRICILHKILFAYRISPCHKLVTIE
jgi:hypothetical protein